MATYASFSAWAQAKNTRKIYLLTLTGKRWNGASVDTITRRYATEWYATLPTDSPANTEFTPLLKSVPEITQLLAWANGSSLNGTPRSFPAFSEAVVSNTGDVLSADWGPDGYLAEGWDAILEVTGPHGELAYANRGALLTGVGGKHRLNDQEMRVELFDNAEKWNVTLANEEITATEYTNLPEANVGKTKPIVLGTVYNQEPILIDDTNFVYLVSSEDAEDITAVYADMNLLVLTTEYTKQLTATGGATLTLVNAPGDARITCDTKGRKIAHLSDTHSNNKGEIIKSLFIEDGGASAGDFNSGAMTTFIAATKNVGIVISEPTPFLTIVDQLLATPLEDYRITGAGEISLHVFSGPSGSPDFSFLTVDGQVVELIGTPEVEELTPIHEAIVTYEHIETVMQETETAGAATLADKLRVKVPYRTKKDADTVVLTWAKRATSLGPLLSRLLAGADATTAAQDLMTLFGVGRWLVRASFRLQPFLVAIGEVVELDRTKLGLTSGGTNIWRVVGRRVLNRGRLVELTLFQ